MVQFCPSTAVGWRARSVVGTVRILSIRTVRTLWLPMSRKSARNERLIGAALMRSRIRSSVPDVGAEMARGTSGSG